MSGQYNYIHDGAAIYARSFVIIRAEANLARFSPEEERVAVRIIHACGMVEVADDILFSPGAAETASCALKAGSADPLRRQHGGAWRDPRATSGG